MGDSIKANKFHLFSSTVTNLLYENNVYLEINRLYFVETSIPRRSHFDMLSKFSFQ